MKLPTKIPTIIGLLFVIVLVGGIVTLERIFRSPSGATGSRLPTKVKITNVTDASFTVSWTTDVPTSGTIITTANGKQKRVYYDTRDQSGKLGSYTTHSIDIRNASPLTVYTVIPLSNGVQYLNNGKPWTVRTTATLSPNSSGLEPAYGTVRGMDDLPIEGALVYLTVEEGQELSTLTKPSGLWLIPLNQLRTSDLTAYLSPAERMTENISIEANGLVGTAVTDTLNDSPVPEMTIGKSYDFRRQQAKASDSKTIALKSSTLPVNGAVLGETTNQSFTLSLISPVNNASLPTTFPLIRGTGIPGTFVGISLGIRQAISGSAKVDAGGLWSFTPPSALSPGKQSVTISGLNDKGQTVAVTHSFVILKSGTQVLGDATPSATLTPETTIEVTPTPIDVSDPTSTLAAEPPPTSGNQLPTILLLLLGIGLFAGAGIVTVRQ